MSSAQRSLSERLQAGVLGNDDPETVVAGLPAYLLLVDGLIDGAPNDAELLCSGAQLYGAYAGNLIPAGARAQRLSARARGYAERAACASNKALCALPTLDFDQTTALLASLDDSQLTTLDCYGQALATDIQARSDDWEAIAEIPKIRVVFERMQQLDPNFGQGNVDLYLGVLNTLLPEAYGGKPELGRSHFERAIEQSAGANLMAKVLYAERYARMVFDRELHDRLLTEVQSANPVASGLTLINTIAKQRATALLASANDYF
jgi:hypothetical protein